jgi:hypothetical protein
MNYLIKIKNSGLKRLRERKPCAKGVEWIAVDGLRLRRDHPDPHIAQTDHLAGADLASLA